MKAKDNFLFYVWIFFLLNFYTCSLSYILCICITSPCRNLCFRTLYYSDIAPIFILQRQQKLQKERLMNDFSAALNRFQAVQRQVSEKEKETVARARAGSRLSVRSVLVKDGFIPIYCSHSEIISLFLIQQYMK